MGKRHDITAGDRFNRLVFLREAERSKTDNRRSGWFRCDCGIEKAARLDRVVSGKILSCGCFQRERASEVKTTHGHTKNGKIPRSYGIWFDIKRRCLDPDNHAYKDYGGRGITICDRWLKFDKFLEDVGEPPSGLTLDRKDNNGNYEPGNVRWSTRKEQANNRRSNRIIEHQGKRQNVATWCEELGLQRQKIYARIKQGITDPALLLR